MVMRLTPGLLVSMAMRLDHSFGFFMTGWEQDSDHCQKQIRLLNEAMGYYKRREELQNSPNREDRQLFEEISGTGFYHPDRENYYQESTLPAALLEAHRIIKENQ